MKLPSVVLVGTMVVASTAAADSKSWAALKGKLSADTTIVGGVDGAALRAAPSFPKMIDLIRADNKDVGEMLDLVKASCGLDIPSVIGDLAFAVNKDAKGVVVFSLTGADQAKATDCLTKMLAKADPKAKLATKVTGKVTEYSTGQSEKFYAAWLAPDVVAIPLEESSPSALDAMIGGGAPSADLTRFLGKTNPAAAGWFAATMKDDAIQGVWATVTLGKSVAVAVRATATTPKAGDQGRKEAKDAQKKGLERSAKQPELKKVFQAMKVGGKGTEVTVDLSVPEASIPALLPALDKVF